MSTPRRTLTNTLVRPQDMLARITREITATEDLPAVLSSIVGALAAHSGMIFSRIWLYATEDQCDWCRAHGRPADALVAAGAMGLHLSASAGKVTSLDRPRHLIPLEASAGPAIAAFQRQPLRSDDILSDPRYGTAPQQAEMLRPLGAKGAGTLMCGAGLLVFFRTGKTVGGGDGTLGRRASCRQMVSKA